MKEHMTLQSSGRQQSLQEWSRKVADCRQSEKSVKRWCEENGVTAKTYYRWQQKVFSAMAEQQERAAQPTWDGPRFTELSIPDNGLKRSEESARRTASIRIGNTAVEFYSGADSDLVRTLYQILS